MNSHQKRIRESAIAKRAMQRELETTIDTARSGPAPAEPDATAAVSSAPDQEASQ